MGYEPQALPSQFFCVHAFNNTDVPEPLKTIPMCESDAFAYYVDPEPIPFIQDWSSYYCESCGTTLGWRRLPEIEEPPPLVMDEPE
jgi:hypothetical protein